MRHCQNLTEVVSGENWTDEYLLKIYQFLKSTKKLICLHYGCAALFPLEFFCCLHFGEHGVLGLIFAVVNEFKKLNISCKALV